MIYFLLTFSVDENVNLPTYKYLEFDCEGLLQFGDETICIVYKIKTNQITLRFDACHGLLNCYRAPINIYKKKRVFIKYFITFVVLNC